MSELNVELCPETGICSIIKGERKIDLMPDEVGTVRDAADAAGIRSVLSDIDSGFAEQLDPGDLANIGARLR